MFFLIGTECIFKAVAAGIGFGDEAADEGGEELRRGGEGPGAVVEDAVMAGGKRAGALEADEREEFDSREGGGGHLERVGFEADVAGHGVVAAAGIEVEGFDFFVGFIGVEDDHALVEEGFGLEFWILNGSAHGLGDADGAHATGPNFEAIAAGAGVGPPVEGEVKGATDVDGGGGFVFQIGLCKRCIADCIN